MNALSDGWASFRSSVYTIFGGVLFVERWWRLSGQKSELILRTMRFCCLEYPLGYNYVRKFKTLAWIKCHEIERPSDLYPIYIYIYIFYGSHFPSHFLIKACLGSEKFPPPLKMFGVNTWTYERRESSRGRSVYTRQLLQANSYYISVHVRSSGGLIVKRYLNSFITFS